MVEATSTKEDLGLINLRNEQVYINLLPSGVTSVMVKYLPELLVSCVMPPQEFTIQYASERYKEKNSVLVKVPTLIMSSAFAEVPNSKNFRSLIDGGFSLWALDTENMSGIYTKPYLLANVWERGLICFGTLHPTSLKQAYNYYWTSNFNGELNRGGHKCKDLIHNYYGHIGCRCDRSKAVHICSCPKTTFHNHFGCGCSTVVESKRCKCDNYLDCACCRSISDIKAKNVGLKKRELSKLLVAENLSCGCSFRHKRQCLCGKRECFCKCYCDCCTHKCNHSLSCSCSCCVGFCYCRCRCTQKQKFEMYIKNYNDVTLPEQRWVDRTSHFCGTNYWASPNGADGVLLTNNKTLLKKVPSNFWRKDRNSSPFIVTLANLVDDEWELESGGFKFRLQEKNVVIK